MTDLSRQQHTYCHRLEFLSELQRGIVVNTCIIRDLCFVFARPLLGVVAMQLLSLRGRYSNALSSATAL